MNEPTPEIKKLAQYLSEHLVDNGEIMKIGWVGFVLACKLKDAPAAQLSEMRLAFFAGAMHVFTSIMSFLEPGLEPTDKDLDRMNKLSDELERFQKDFEARMKSRN